MIIQEKKCCPQGSKPLLQGDTNLKGQVVKIKQLDIYKINTK